MMLERRTAPQIGAILLWLAALVGGGQVCAHEFWIEPTRFDIAAGDKLQAHLRVGQNLEGEHLLYLPQTFQRFDLVTGDGITPVASRIGDNPALNQAIADPGLLVVAYVSAGKQLIYTQRSKFERFLHDEGLGWVEQAHAERGLPESGFKEIYQRFAKSLVRIGHGIGQDSALGLELELVVDDNPYLSEGDSLDVRLLWRGEPMADSRINLFRRHAGELTRSQHVTDGDGRIRLMVRDRPGLYLLNAVHMVDPGANPDDAVWKSLWASTTFMVDD